MNAWRCAGVYLREERRCVRMLSAADILPMVLMTCAGWYLQIMLCRGGFLSSLQDSPAGTWELWLSLYLLTVLLVTTPIQVQSAWLLGEITGVLDADDIGFLRCSSYFWLWRRMFAVRLLLLCRLLMSFLPACVCMAAAGLVLHLIPPEQDALFALMTGAHLLLAAAGLLILPARELGVWLALPMSFLKLPHKTAAEIVRNARRLSRCHSAGILLRRAICFPLLMVPPVAFFLLPHLRAAELIWAERRWQQCGCRSLMRL